MSETIDLSNDDTVNLGTNNFRSFETISNYELLSLLGRGGMASVFKARHKTSPKNSFIEDLITEAGVIISKEQLTKLNNVYEKKALTSTTEVVDQIPPIVALKVFENDNEEFVKRFGREFKTTYKLRKSSRFVRVFELGSEGSKHYYSMELIEGKLPKNPSLEESLLIVKQACEGLSYAHSFNIVHRDFKPANMGLREDEDYVILDLGISKDKTDTTLTNTGAVMGTPQYMSPEQAVGEKEIDLRTDIYALGVMLHEFVTGTHPSYGKRKDDIEVFLASVASPDCDLEKLPSSYGVDKNLEAIILKSIAKNKNERYSSCEELLQDIENYERGENVNALTYSRKYKLKRFVKKNSKKLKKASLLLMTGLTFTLGSFFYQNIQGKNTLNNLSEQYSFVKQEIDETNSVDLLLNLEQSLNEKIDLTKKAVQKYEGKSYEEELLLLEQKFIQEKKEINKKILINAKKEIQHANIEKSKELLNIILEKSFEYKLAHLRDNIPSNSIPDMTINGKYKFTTVNRDSDNSYYPAMLRMAYEVTGDEKFLEHSEKLSELIVNNRVIDNNSLSEFYDYLLLQAPNSQLQTDLMLRFNGSFFRAVDNVDSTSASREQLHAGSNIYLDAVLDAFFSTGNIDYWNAYKTHMETSLRAVRDDGLVWRVVGIAQEDKFVESIQKNVQKGETFYTVGFRDWKNKEDLFALVQPQAGISFVKYYSLTKDERFLEKARSIADRMLELSENHSWNWNLCDSVAQIPNKNDSFTTVMMANFLLDLSLWETDEVRKRIYYENSIEVLKRIDLSTELSYEGFVRGVQDPDRGLVDVSASGTDYFFFLALQKLQSYERYSVNEISDDFTTSNFLRETTGEIVVNDRTIVQLRKDEQNLYLNFKCYSPSENDFVEITLDNLSDDKDFYSFIFNQQGKVKDGYGPENEGTLEWTCHVGSEFGAGSLNKFAVAVESIPNSSANYKPQTANSKLNYWMAEIVIPLKNGNYDFNIFRKSSEGFSSLAFMQKYHRNLKQLERRDMFEIKKHKLIF